MDFSKLNSIEPDTPSIRKTRRAQLKLERKKTRRAIRLARRKVRLAEKARRKALLKAERRRLRLLRLKERRIELELKRAEMRRLSELKRHELKVRRHAEEIARREPLPKRIRPRVSYPTGGPRRERQRTRTSTVTIVDSSGIHISSADYRVEYFREDTYPGSCQCLHWRATSPGVRGAIHHNPIYHASVVPGFDPSYVTAFEQIVMNDPVFHPYLKWDKLVSSSQSNLIMLFAELDETLSLFALRTYKKFFEVSLREGRWRMSNAKTIPAFIEWGLLPFIGELQKIGRMVENLYAQVQAYGYRSNISLVRFQENPGPYASRVTFNVTGSYGVKGIVSIGDTSSLSVILDRLGLHPDLQTAWDLVPWSFLLDDIVQVSNALDCLWPRGWVGSVPFYGWTSYSLKVSYKEELLNPHSYGPPQVYATGDFEYYYRYHYSGRPLEKLPPLATDPELLKAPSMRTICNILYAIVLSFNL